MGTLRSRAKEKTSAKETAEIRCVNSRGATMGLTDKATPDLGTRIEGHRRSTFDGQRSSVPKPQDDSESPVGLGRSATRQLLGFRCHVGVDDKATPGTETARSFSNEANLGPGVASSPKSKATPGTGGARLFSDKTSATTWSRVVGGRPGDSVGPVDGGRFKRAPGRVARSGSRQPRSA